MLKLPSALYKKPSIALSGSFWVAIFFLVIQQLIVASSSIWITRVILHIPEGAPALFWLWLYLASLVLPYFPGALALIEVAKAQVSASVSYVRKFAELYPGRILEWSSHDQRATKSSILSGEAHPTITSYVEYLYLLCSSGMNVLFNLTVLAVLIDKSLLITYVAGLVFAFLLLYLQKNSKKRLALKAQQSRIRWISLLLKAWDNVLLNNLYNLKIWKENVIERSNRLVGKTIELERFSQSVSIAMAFLLITPSLGLVAYFAYTRIDDIAFLAIVTVTLPRLFQVLNFSYEMLFLLADFPMQRAKLGTVASVIDPDQNQENMTEFANRIEWEKIIAQEKKSTTDSAEVVPRQLLHTLPKTGRITLRGENGSGKTSLLLSLKMKYHDEAFYLPSKHDLLFRTNTNRASTGQVSSQILKEIKDKINVSVILLDEWDASLDKNNRAEISSLIDELALEHCVIEVLHNRQH